MKRVSAHIDISNVKRNVKKKSTVRSTNLFLLKLKIFPMIYCGCATPRVCVYVCVCVPEHCHCSFLYSTILNLNNARQVKLQKLLGS